MTVQYDPYSDEALENPLALYKTLRDEAPVYFIESRNSWAISSIDSM